MSCFLPLCLPPEACFLVEPKPSIATRNAAREKNPRMSNYAMAVDIGGTFTDVVLRGSDGRTFVDKTLTPPKSLAVGFFSAIDAVLKTAGIKPAAVTDVLVHATTVVTNAVIERKGPLTALLVTEGFRDILSIRDEHRYEMFDPQIEFPEPLIAREMTFGVAERVLATGEVLKAIDAAQVEAIGDELKRKGAVSVAVSLLNSYLNPANERAIQAIIAKRAPDLYVSISSDVAPQIREYPRTSTAAMNAYTMPITGPYLDALRRGLKQRGFVHDPLIMLSNGGVIGTDIAKRFPARMVESGPPARAVAGSEPAAGGAAPASLSNHGTRKSVRKAPPRCRVRSATAAAARTRP